MKFLMIPNFRGYLDTDLRRDRGAKGPLRAVFLVGKDEKLISWLARENWLIS